LKSSQLIKPSVIGFKSFCRSYDAVIRVYDESGIVLETHEHKGDFRAFESGQKFHFRSLSPFNLRAIVTFS
jgi:hypothetical protein